MAHDALALSEEDHNWEGSICLCEFSLKFVALFRYEFQGVVSMEGKCPQVLYDAMEDIATMWCNKTQAIEGANNIVKGVGRVAPNISWELMSARGAAKKDPE